MRYPRHETLDNLEKDTVVRTRALGDIGWSSPRAIVRRNASSLYLDNGDEDIIGG